MGPHFKWIEFQKYLYKAIAAALLINKALYGRYYLRNHLTSRTEHLQNCFHRLIYQVVSSLHIIHLENIRSVALYVLVSTFAQI